MSDYYGLPTPTPGVPGAVMAPSAQDLASLYSGAGASSAGGGSSMLSGLLGRMPSVSMEGFQGPAYLGGTGETGLLASLAPALPPVLAGQAATFGLNKALPSTGAAGDVRQTLADAATWAGIGAGVGSVVPGVGTAVGGVAGGVAGGAYGLLDSMGLLGSNNTPSTDDIKSQISSAATQLKLDPAEYTTAFDLLSKNGADPQKLGQQLTVQMLQDAQQQKAIDAAQQQQAQQQTADQKFGLAMQAQAQQFFTPYVNNIITSGLAQSQALQGLANQLPPQYRDVMLNQSQQALAHSQNLASAYAAQSALIPGQFMAQAELKREQAIAQLQYQQAVVQARQTSGGGGAAGLVNQVPNPSQAAPTVAQLTGSPTG